MAVASSEVLVARWQEAIADPVLHDLPYRIELNAWGKVEMTLASNRHGRLQAALALELGRQLQGMALADCSILTRSGIRVADVAWASPAFMRAFGEITPYTYAPEICVQILSAADAPTTVADKTAAFLATGAYEVWLVAEDASIRFVGPSGDQAQSRFPVSISLPPPLQAAP